MPKFVFYVFFLLFSFNALGQGQVKKFSLNPSGLISVSLQHDSGFLVSTHGLDRFLWIRADLHKFGTRFLKSQFRHTINASTSNKYETYILGTISPYNSTLISPIWLMLAKLDSCLEPVWQKKIILQEKYLDTTIENRNIFATKLISDENGNVYIITANENTNIAKNQQDINRYTSYIYKFNPTGELVYRKPILTRLHTNLAFNCVSYHKGIIYLGGDAYFPIFGESDTSKVFVTRGVVVSLDTIGNIIQTKVFEEDTTYFNSINNLVIEKDDTIVICSQYGEHFNQPKKYAESNLLILDKKFEVIKSIKSSEKDSLFFLDWVTEKYLNNEFTCFKRYQVVSQSGDLFSRTGYGYLYHLGANFEVKDSAKIDFFYPSNFSDSTFNVYDIINNPLNDSISTFFGTSNQNSPSFYFYIVNVNAKGQAIDSLYVPNYPQTLCEGNYIESTIFFSSFDTICFITIFNQNLSDPATQLQELKEPELDFIVPFPNPTNNKFCFDQFDKIDKVILFTMQSSLVVDLIPESNCFLLPENFKEGIYFLKVIMKNSTVKYSRVELLRN